MGLDVRKKHADSVIKMLHFNAPPGSLATKSEEELYKVLILDRHTKDVLAPLLHVDELRRHGVTLHMLLDTDRQPIPDVPAVYYVLPTEATVQVCYFEVCVLNWIVPF